MNQLNVGVDDTLQESFVFPEIRDTSGYQLQEPDFQFLGITSDAAWECKWKKTPLGMGEGEFESFLSSLSDGLWRDGLRDADVRIQGSSANFFSSRLKELPRTKQELAEVFIKEQGRFWRVDEEERILDLLMRHWPDSYPRQRPFDSLYKLGLSPDKSDIDIQISSDLAIGFTREYLLWRGYPLDTFNVDSEHYGFIRREFSKDLFPVTNQWANYWTSRLDRAVVIVMFGSSGPPINSQGKVSSHHKETDWILIGPEKSNE